MTLWPLAGELAHAVDSSPVSVEADVVALARQLARSVVSRARPA